ncbi:hypothetical protein B0H11DRAFT_2238806 [Mycena galericulata]|nr:hypothetical protein B0H11DRAFT_2238806 [Mycena galericulata]
MPVWARGGQWVFDDNVGTKAAPCAVHMCTVMLAGPPISTSCQICIGPYVVKLTDHDLTNNTTIPMHFSPWACNFHRDWPPATHDAPRPIGAITEAAHAAYMRQMIVVLVPAFRNVVLRVVESTRESSGGGPCLACRERNELCVADAKGQKRNRMCDAKVRGGLRIYHDPYALQSSLQLKGKGSQFQREEDGYDEHQGTARRGLGLGSAQPVHYAVDANSASNFRSESYAANQNMSGVEVIIDFDLCCVVFKGTMLT